MECRYLEVDTMAHAKTDLIPSDMSEADDPQRRKLALALFGVLGGASLLEACAADGGGGAAPEYLGEAVSALNGTSNINWVDTVPNLRALTGAANWIAIVEGRFAAN